MKDEEQRPIHSVNDELKRAIQRAADRGEITSQDDVEAFAQRHIDNYNTRPQDELGGLSPVHAFQLLRDEWVSGPRGEMPGPNDPPGPTDPPQPAVYLADDLEPGRITKTPFFLWSHRFVTAVAAADGVKATARGNLPRKFVDLMLQMDIWPDGYLASVKRHNKVINENDHWWLHVTRIVADMAGLVKRRKGIFRVTHLGRQLTEREDLSGRLFALLFQAHFRALNLAYLDGCADARSFQDTIAYPLWRFGSIRRAWQTAEALAPQLVLPAVRDEIPLSSPAGYEWDQAPVLIERRLLKPLVQFGLAESRPSPQDDGPQSDSGVPRLPRDEYRLTDLFGEFLEFCPEPVSVL